MKSKAVLCIFGKHPGEVDHIESLGLETSFLIEVRRSLYEQGIAWNIGRWEDYAKNSGTNLIPYHHDFLYQKKDEAIIGRMWYSRDRKDRDHYPMVCCIHAPHSLLLTNFWQIQSFILEIEKECRKSTSIEEVRNIVTKNRAKITEQLNTEGFLPKKKEFNANLAFRKVYGEKAFGSDFEGLARILYAIEQTLTYKSQKERVSANRSGILPLRIPLQNTVKETLDVWLSVLKSQIGRNTMCTFFFPANMPWFDLILGDPTVSEYTCIKAPLDIIPYTHTELSIQPDPAFMQTITSQLIPVLEQKSKKKIPRIIRIKRRQRDDDSKFSMMKNVLAHSIKEQKKDLHNRLSPRLVLVLVTILILVLGILFVHIHSGRGIRETENLKQPSQPSPDQQWWKLSSAYHSWFASFQENLTENHRSAWEYHAELKKALKILHTIEKEGKVIAPAKIMGVQGVNQTLLDDLSESMSAEALQQGIHEDLQRIQQIGDRLLRVRTSAFDLLNSEQSRFESLGWEKPAEILKLSKQKFRNPEKSLSPLIVEKINAYLKMKETLSEINSLLNPFLGHQKLIRETKDKILVRFCENLKDTINRVNSLDELAPLLRKWSGENGIIRELTPFLEQFWDRQKLDIDSFTNDSKIHQESSARIDEGLVQVWLQEVLGYQRLDPTLLEDAKQKWQRDLNRLNQDILDLSESDCVNVSSFVLEKQRLEQETSLEIPRVRKNKAMIKDHIARIHREMDQLIQGVEHEKITCSEDLRELHATDVISENHPSLNEEWRYWRAYWHSEMRNPSVKGAENSGLPVRKDRLLAILEFLRAIDQNGGLGDPSGKNASPALEPGFPFHALHVLINKRIMQRIREYISREPSLRYETFAREITLWRQDLFQAVDDHLEFEKSPDADFLVDTKNEQFDLEAIKQKLWPQKDWVVRLQSLAKQDIRTTVAEIPLEDRPNSVVASFLWWGTRPLEDWPRNLREFTYEIQLRRLIKEIMNTKTKNYPHWAEELKTSMTKEASKRWLFYTDLETDPEALDVSFSVMDQFNVTNAELAPEKRFNAFLYSWKKDDYSQRNEEEVKIKCKQLLQRIQNNFMELQENEKIKDLMRKLKSISERSNSAVISDLTPEDTTAPESSLSEQFHQILQSQQYLAPYSTNQQSMQ